MSVFGRTLLVSWSSWLLFGFSSLALCPVLIGILRVFPMLSFLFFMSFGLVRGFSSRRLYLFIGGLISPISSCRLFLFGPGIDIRRSCKLLGVMLRALWALFWVALAGFSLVLLVPTTAGYAILVGKNFGHGVTSRSREASNVKFLDELLLLSGYPPGSGVALLRGSLPLRYCTSRFAHKVPTWSLLVSGGVAFACLFMSWWWYVGAF